MSQKDEQADELFFVVDEHNHPLEPLPRRLVHGHGVWHRVSHVWIINNAGQILCQRRASIKEINPDKWEAFFGGHLAPGESDEQGALRETREELELRFALPDLRKWKIHRRFHPSGYNNEFQAIFMVRWNGSIDEVKFDSSEVAQVAWRSKAEVRQAFLQKDKGWTFTGYELELLETL